MSTTQTSYLRDVAFFDTKRYTLCKNILPRTILVAIVKVTEKGQVTLPVELRRKLGIGKDDYLMIEVEGSVLKVRKISEKKLLESDDPIWDWVGQHASGDQDVSAQHDRYLAEGERKRWRKR